MGEHRTLILSMTQPLKVDHFDQVLVLKKGKIVFDGAPEVWKSWRQKTESLETAVVGERAS